MIRRSIRFDAGPPQTGLQTLDIAGDPNYRVDPYTDDVIKRLVELRRHIKQQRQQAEADGDSATEARPDAIELGLKIATPSNSRMAAPAPPTSVTWSRFQVRGPIMAATPNGRWRFSEFEC